MSKTIISPCISICKTDPVTGFCYGCARTEEEKKLWKDESTNSEYKSKNLCLNQTRHAPYASLTFILIPSFCNPLFRS